ncbi:MAG TPA: FeoA family protein [Candidatus Omnitrophota bacterium]|nr:FeoA family protein [Candidatus Omnitrophota bacterium]
MKCSLCGFEFQENEGRSVCEGCVLAKSCSLIKCPRCHFELVPDSEVTQWERKLSLGAIIRSFLSRRKGVPGETPARAASGPSEILKCGEKVIPLPDLQPNNRGKIAGIGFCDRNALRKMMVMGVFPGVEIELIQRFPSCVFRIGQSRFTVDRELASLIHVKSSG